MSLCMVHLPLRPGALVRHGREHRLVDQAWSADDGYLVHSLLARLFADDAPRCFALGEDGSHLLAYSRIGHESLAEAARVRADAAVAAVEWGRVGSKLVPTFETGRRLGFRVRVCPVVRAGAGHPRFGAGAEVDPYLLQVERALATAEVAHSSLDKAFDRLTLKASIIAALPAREAVYRAWLTQRFGGAVSGMEARMTAMCDARLWRKGEPKPGPAQTMHLRPRPQHAGRSVIGRRDVTFEGTLTVADPTAFAACLARGIGRHRAFGFGMVLLRPC